MPTIKIATKGISRTGVRTPAGETPELGVNVIWVEIDGHRFDTVTDAHVDAPTNGATTVTMTLIGAIQMVILDADFNEVVDDRTDP